MLRRILGGAALTLVCGLAFWAIPSLLAEPVVGAAAEATGIDAAPADEQGNPGAPRLPAPSSRESAPGDHPEPTALPAPGGGAEASPAAGDAAATPGGAAALGSVEPLLPESVRAVLQDRKYDAAIRAIDEAIQKDQAPRDYLVYLKGRVLSLAGKYDEAVAAFDRVPAEFPRSDWLRRARFGKAMALARKGDFRAAELIVRAEAEYLLSEDRKQQIAAIYLEFADACFDPPKRDDRQPDYQKALDFYQRALEVGPKPDKRAEVELRSARCQQELGNLDEAAAGYEQFIKQRAGHAMEIEARWRLGECRLAQGNGKLARRVWQDLLAKFPGARDERVAEACFHLSRTWNIPQPNTTEELNLGTAALEAFLERFPTHKLASQAHLDIARSFLHRGRHEDAARALNRYLADPRYEQCEEIPEARNLLGAAYQLQKKFDEALRTWQECLAKHPAYKAWRSVQQQIIQTEYLMAQEKFEEEQYDEAAKLFAAFLDKYPLDRRNPEILVQLGQMAFNREQWEEAVAQWRRVVSKYPGTEAASRAQYRVAETLEQKLGRLDEALDEYKKVTWGSAQNDARQAVARLVAKSMTVATERVFRSQETPRLKLITRNIEQVDVRAYRVDLETYFRKMHLAGGVESLDIALIDPDATFEFKVPGYAKYQELDSAVDVPLPGGDRAGVMAVTVASKTLEATTLVVQSDLDIIVKSSRDEVFVFAENMRTGKPWPGVRLLISNGNQVFAEEKTGEDGTLRKSFPELKDAADVRVFAVADGHTASNLVDLGGVGAAQGLADKGYLYTDRPAYRAGQLVHVRGCLRGVRDDRYVVDRDKKYTLDVFDGRDRQVYSQEVTLNEFGAFHARFVLPPTSPQGRYRLVARDKDGKSYQGTFQVHEYQLEPVHLTIETPRDVYYRGETIEGTIRAAYYYGAPLAGREIRYQLADDRSYTATTDEKGEARVSLPTQEFSETQMLPLVVTLPERNLSVAKNLMLSTQGFYLTVASFRSVYVAGETFEVTATARDAEGKPLAEKLTLKIIEKTTVRGKVGERVVAQYAVETSPADGTARQTLQLDEGGQYVVRAEGTDRFHNPIAGEYSVMISGKDDEVRLRILADRHWFKAGDTANIRLHWREQPALALVTFQGARILDYRLVELRTGENVLEVPMTPELAPNFELAVAVMIDPPAEPAERPKAEQPKPEQPAAEQPGAEQPKPAAEAGRPSGAEAAAAPGDRAAKASERPTPDSEASPGTKKPVGRFHTASSPFEVQRELKVSLTVRGVDGAQPAAGAPGEPAGAEKVFRPNQEIEVVVTATDPQGKPVAAELSLVLVEQALLDRFGWQVAAIEEFFRGLRREPAVRTTSSITFEYRPATQPINPRLLAERDRLEIAAEKAESLGAISAEFERAAREDVAAASRPTSSSFGLGFTGAEPANGPVVAEEPPMSPEGMPDAADAIMADADELFVIDKSGVVDESERRRIMRYGGAVAKKGDASDKRASLRGGLSPNGRFDEFKPVSETYFFVPRGAEALDQWVVANAGQLTVLDASGRMVQLAINTESWDLKKAAALADELSRSGAVLLPGAMPQETGYWNPAVRTDAEGKAVVRLTLPDRSTAWRLLAKGITVDTLAGESTDRLVVRKPLFGQLKLPPALVDGDKARIEATVHNDLVSEGRIDVVLKTTIGSRSFEEKKTLDVKSKGIHEVAFDVAFDAAPADEESDPAAEREAIFELVVSAGDSRDVARRGVPIRPFGMLVYATAGGAAASDTTAWVEPPKGMALQRPTLEILVGPTVERSLLDILLAPAPTCQSDVASLASGPESTASDLMAAVGLQRLLGGTREAGGPLAESLDAKVRSSIGLMISSQNDDGGWSWTGRGRASRPATSARVVWALVLARKAGYAVSQDAYDKALGYLRAQGAATAETDYETKAILLHALSVAGQGDFALANRLYRNRPALSPAALAYLALGFAEMDRKPVAEELLDLLLQKNLDDMPTRRAAADGALPWNHSAVELRALGALGLEQVAPQSPKLKELVEWLMANRTGHRWAPDKATGPAALALSHWYAQSRFEGERYALTVFVNDVEAARLDIDPAAGTQTVRVPAKLLKPDQRQRVNFQLAGRGRYTYQCILGGFVPADKLAATTPDWRIERHYEPAPLEVDGREIPRGFGVLQGSYTSFRNPLTQLPVGRRGVVQIQLWRANITSNTPEEQLEYLVLVEPIPGGATVIENSVQGPFERFEITPGAIIFHIGSRRDIGTIRYELYGYLPGEYRAAPSVARDAHRPERIVVAAPKPLAVLSAGQASADAYRLTPQELYELGKLHYEKGDMAAAGKHLGELVDQWNLSPEVYKHSIEMLLDVHLATGPAAQIVRYFEIIKEKWPSVEIPFAKIIKVAAAYHEMGEYERSYLVYRATIESSLMRESRVAGFLQAQGEFLRGVEVMSRLLGEYPPEGYVAAAHYALAQSVYAKAPEAAADANLRKAKVNRVALIRQGWAMLESFLTAYPDDPAADQAAFASANALLDLELYKPAADACRRYAERYPNSELLDSFWYMIGYCHFAAGEHRDALEMCRKVAEAKRVDPKTGREEEAANKWRAIYILGQIHHSLGEAAAAIEEYRRVEDRFPDAREAIDYFTRKSIELPEVTTLRSFDVLKGAPAAADPQSQPPLPSVELKYRNIASCDVKVYRIDLMKFTLLKRDLKGITQINLSGIRPYHEATIQLGDGKDYRDRNTKLPLPLNEEGAYLVVCRGDNLYASGLVLVTPLAIEVQEEPSSGRVRATVRSSTDDAYIRAAHVKVIGSGNDEFVAGETDLRGVFVADGIAGTSTVIAQADGPRYAFFRGTAWLGAPPQPTSPAAPAEQAKPAAQAPKGKTEELIEGLKSQNRMFQGKQVEQLQEFYENSTGGVEASDAF